KAVTHVYISFAVCLAHSLIYPLDSVARSEVWMAYISPSDWARDPDWPSNHIAAKEPVRYDGCQVDRQGCTLLKRTGFALPHRSHRRWYVQRPGTSDYGQRWHALWPQRPSVRRVSQRIDDSHTQSTHSQSRTADPGHLPAHHHTQHAGSLVGSVHDSRLVQPRQEPEGKSLGNPAQR